MCGITGFIDSRTRYRDETGTQVLQAMTLALKHRGPNDQGWWHDDKDRVFLGHTRLSIIDLSSEGHQPMVSRDGRFVMVFNGEIYNYKEIQSNLSKEGHRLRGHSDTEVLLEAISAWGLDKTLKKCGGMWAFALWDRANRSLTLSRDRIGKKPLYYGINSGLFVFASELKALRAVSDLNLTINRDALTQFFRYRYIPAPLSVYEGIYKLEPGCLLRLPLKELGKLGDRKSYLSYVSPYWRADQFIGDDYRNQDITESEAQTELERLLKDSVCKRMISDVPLGAFLSGGIDSSLVVALMQEVSRSRVKTFTMGYKEQDYSEAVHARAVAKYLGTDHTEMQVSSDDALAVIPLLPTLYDEPFADASEIPTYLLARLTREHVTVALTGDGGDEVFAGYTRYLWGRKLWRIMHVLPLSARKILGQLLAGVSIPIAGPLAQVVNTVIPKSLQFTNVETRLSKLAEIIDAASQHNLYQNIVSDFKYPGQIVKSAHEPMERLESLLAQAKQSSSYIEQMMYLDIMTYLPDEILVKVDRATMANSLEARSPLLDHRLIEYAWSLPLKYKLKAGTGKYLLRSILYKKVPKELIDRPKMGFGVPVDVWLRGPLKDWAVDLLSAQNFSDHGLLNREPIMRLWNEHQAQKRNWANQLWSVLMFQAWYQSQESTLPS